MRATVVVNATGVWADEVRALDEAWHPDSIRPAKGVHVTIPWDKVRNDIAVVIPVPKDKRSLFVVPAERRRHVPAHLRRHDRYRLRRTARRSAVHRSRPALRAAGAEPLDDDGRHRGDVTAVGRLAAAGETGRVGRTADLSRRHRVASSERRHQRHRRQADDLPRDGRPTRSIGPWTGWTAGPLEDQAPPTARSRRVTRSPRTTTAATCCGATARSRARSRRSSRTRRWASRWSPACRTSLRSGVCGASRDGPLGGRRPLTAGTGPPARSGGHRRRRRLARLLAPELGWSGAEIEQEAAAYRHSVEHEAAATRRQRPGAGRSVRSLE